MNLIELEERWKSLNQNNALAFKSLRINASSVPDLYLSLDLKGNRFLILSIPDNTDVQCQKVEMENLSIEWHPETRYILIGLHNQQFTDLFNELVLSLYFKIKDISTASVYTREFITSFHKWAHFFDSSSLILLSESEIKGLFGELLVLRQILLDTNDSDYNNVLESWQGPYKGIQDFIFSSRNIEVKTKDFDKSTVRISSENQLQVPFQKILELAVVDVVRHNQGLGIQNLIAEIKEIIIEKASDIAIFIKALIKAGINHHSIVSYESYKWNPVQITFYNYNLESNAPRIISSELSSSILNVKYDIKVEQLENFINRRILF